LAWHFKDVALFNYLLKFNHMSDFNKINVNWRTKEWSI
jgi:hypothetical protein